MISNHSTNKVFIKLLLVLLLCAGNAYGELKELPDIIKANWQDAQQIGQAKFSRFGIHIYDASYWSLNNDNEQQAKALLIRYARNISAKRLVSSTYKEWKRLGFTQRYPTDAWLDSLEKIWPDVKPGDHIIFISSYDGSNAFYSFDKKLGNINNKQFNHAFLDIWLSPNAKYQKHRKELLGEDI